MIMPIIVNSVGRGNWTFMYCDLLGISYSVTYIIIHNFTLFDDYTRDSIANNFVIGVYCRCLQILYQIAFFHKI